eukprot:SAG31_NODE_338_length_17490_cov_7.707032_4_plen_34_part_00
MLVLIESFIYIVSKPGVWHMFRKRKEKVSLKFV